MQRSPAPKPVVMLSLAALAVELPFLVTCVLVQLLRDCSHCRHEWLSWPILPGVFPWYFATFTLKIIPKDFSIAQLKAGWGVFTVSLIALLFALTKTSTLWRQVLAAALVVSTALAVMACALIAA